MAADDSLGAAARDLQSSLERFTRTDMLDEFLLAQCERETLRLFATAQGSGRESEEILGAISPLLQSLIDASTAKDLPLSDETEALIHTFRGVGIALAETRARRPSRPLSAAPREPTGFSVFVDESGSASFTEASQPVLCMAGVVVRDDAVQPFEEEANALLREYALPPQTEIHAGEWLSRRQHDPVPALSLTQRDELLRRFLALGMHYAKGLHYLPMAKTIVKPAYREKIRQQGLDAYTHTVLWFAVTLDRALLPVTMPAGYRYFYDQHSSKDVGRIFRALAETQDPMLRLLGLKGKQTKLDSRESRLIQLADVASYYLSRYRDFELPVLTPRPGLDRHEAQVREAFALVRPKVLDYVGKDLARTWSAKALANFSLRAPRSRRR